MYVVGRKRSRTPQVEYFLHAVGRPTKDLKNEDLTKPHNKRGEE
jgi:hypothetical protein